MIKLFVSYDDFQDEYVKHLLKGLKRQNGLLKVKKYEQNESYDVYLNAIRDCDIFICCLNDDFDRSVRRRAELAFCIEQKKQIYFFVFEKMQNTNFHDCGQFRFYRFYEQNKHIEDWSNEDFNNLAKTFVK
jgi:hypothetical protein